MICLGEKEGWACDLNNDNCCAPSHCVASYQAGAAPGCCLSDNKGIFLINGLKMGEETTFQMGKVGNFGKGKKACRKSISIKDLCKVISLY